MAKQDLVKSTHNKIPQNNQNLENANMIKFTVKKQNRFTIIDNKIIESKDLSWRAKGLLIYLLSRPENWQPNKQDLINRSPNEGKKGIDSALTELKENGYLILEKVTLKDKSIKYRYTVYEDPNNVNTDIPLCDLSESERSDTDTPQSDISEMGIHNNTNLTNTNLNNTKENNINNNKQPIDVDNFCNDNKELNNEVEAKTKETVKSVLNGIGISKDDLVKQFNQRYNLAEIKKCIEIARLKDVDSLAGYVISVLKAGFVIPEDQPKKENISVVAKAPKDQIIEILKLSQNASLSEIDFFIDKYKKDSCSDNSVIKNKAKHCLMKLSKLVGSDDIDLLKKYILEVW